MYWLFFPRNVKEEWSNLSQITEFPVLWSHIRVFFNELPQDLLGEKSFYIESVFDYMIDKPCKTVVSLKESKQKLVMSNYRIIQPEDFSFWFKNTNKKKIPSERHFFYIHYRMERKIKIGFDKYWGLERAKICFLVIFL